MSVAVITGSGGLIGAEAAQFFAAQGLDVVGIDNDMRSRFFGPGASTRRNWAALERLKNYAHLEADIRDTEAIERLFRRHSAAIAAVIHTAAQPSHDWAARDPLTDFSINATATLTLLEATRKYCPQAVFIFCSTNKVYGDTPNRLPLVELETRWELQEPHPFAAHGIDETMSIDASTHSIFGVSKCGADLMVQEYGRYFGIATACFRGGCLTGPGHAGAELHGFLSYLVKCAVTGERYTIFGYGGKQVRDNVHSADLVQALWHVFQNPRVAEVYNMGGGRYANCSVIEAVKIVENLIGRPMSRVYVDENRIGDHIWWISDLRRFQSHYPEWRLTRDIPSIIAEIYDSLAVCQKQPAKAL
jgi:CDP-paratose 2-epimerase